MTELASGFTRLAEKTDAKEARLASIGLETQYSFPTKSACDRCHSFDTQRTSCSKDGRTQYRACLVPICSHRYKVIGSPVKGIPKG